MPEAERVVVRYSIDLPSDWHEQVSRVASRNELEAVDLTVLPGNTVTFDLRPAGSMGADRERFQAAVAATTSEVTRVLSPPPLLDLERLQAALGKQLRSQLVAAHNLSLPQPPYEDRLTVASERARSGQSTETSGRELLSWFGAARRGTRVVERIRKELQRHGLVTEPDFNEAWVDSPIKLILAPASVVQSAASPRRAPPADPVHRVGRLDAANQGIESAKPGSSVEIAMTTMMLFDYSQLPVMRTERDCRGAVSWQSIGHAHALGRPCKTVDDCLLPAEEVGVDASLLDVIPRIVSQGFVLVRGNDKVFQGIVTVSDLSLQVRFLSEPFLLLGQIESFLRALVGRTFSVDEIRAAKNPGDTSRIVNGASDLSFGEYIRLLETAAVWPRLKVRFARDPFLAALKEIGEIRNDVMHFDPEPLEDVDMGRLRHFAAFLEQAVDL